MIEFLLRVEEACLQLATWHLVVPGICLIVLGLFLWLGGVRYAFLVAGLFGAALGGLLGLLASRWFGLEMSLAVAGGAVIMTILSLLLQNLVVIGLAIVLFSAVGGFSYLAYSLDQKGASGSADSSLRDSLPSVSDVEALVRHESESLRETSGSEEDSTASEGVRKLIRIRDEISELASTNRTMVIVCAVGGAFLGLLLGYFLKKLMMAISCSIIGSSGAILGMGMLLLAKGSPVISTLQERPKLLPTLFIVMLIIGCMAQLILAGAKKMETTTEDEDKET